MTKAAAVVWMAPDVLPAGCAQVIPGGLLSKVRRACSEHGADAYCVGRYVDGDGLVYWCDRGHHHTTSTRRPGASAFSR